MAVWGVRSVLWHLFFRGKGGGRHFFKDAYCSKQLRNKIKIRINTVHKQDRRKMLTKTSLLVVVSTRISLTFRTFYVLFLSDFCHCTDQQRTVRIKIHEIWLYNDNNNNNNNNNNKMGFVYTPSFTWPLSLMRLLQQMGRFSGRCRCREAKISVNVWTVRRNKKNNGCCTEVAVREGSAVSVTLNSSTILEEPTLMYFYFSIQYWKRIDNLINE